MRIDDLHLLPHVDHSASFLYLEYGRLEQDDRAAAFVDKRGRVSIPLANLSLLMLGPGTTATHRAICNAAECGCLVVWAGEQGVRLYAAGLGDTRSARNLLTQARWHADEGLHLTVVRRMYQMRFDEPLDDGLTLRQIRGHEGVRVRECYRRMSEETGVEWTGRSYRRTTWERTSPVNQALSAANSCLYGICHAAIISAGFSPALGFVHTGNALSFVHDVADLYKTDTTIPAAFRAAASGTPDPARAVRHELRDAFHESRILGRIVNDVRSLFLPIHGGEPGDDTNVGPFPPHDPNALWDPAGAVEGGTNYGDPDGVDGAHS